MESQNNSIYQNCEIKKVRYNRISTVNGSQKLDRQRTDMEAYDIIIEDSISGLIPFFERPGGAQVKHLIDSGIKFNVHVIGIDRIGRSLADCAYLIQYMTDNGIGLVCPEQNLVTLKPDRSPDAMSIIFVNLLLVFSSVEKGIQRQRILQGVAVRKAKGLYKGRVQNSCESDSHFLNKPKIERFLRLYKTGWDHYKKSLPNMQYLTRHCDESSKTSKAESVTYNTIMFKYAHLKPHPDGNGFQIIDRRINRPVGEVMRNKKGGYKVFIRGQLIGEASISWHACFLADKYLAIVGSQPKIRKN